MAKASAKKPKESKCRGSAAPLEGRDWVRIGGNKWLREVAEKQGKYIPKEYAEKSGAQFDKDRASRALEAEEKAKRALISSTAPVEETSEDDAIPDAEAPMDEATSEFAAEEAAETVEE
ncbi:MAG: hypothetical protein WC314_20040 [Vulcanimicrobiota bacterium]